MVHGWVGKVHRYQGPSEGERVYRKWGPREAVGGDCRNSGPRQGPSEGVKRVQELGPQWRGWMECRNWGLSEGGMGEQELGPQWGGVELGPQWIGGECKNWDSSVGKSLPEQWASNWGKGAQELGPQWWWEREHSKDVEASGFLNCQIVNDCNFTAFFQKL